MDKQLWNAIQAMLDDVDFAIKALEPYRDYEDDPRDLQPSPNNAMIAHKALEESLRSVEALMPKEPS